MLSAGKLSQARLSTLCGFAAVGTVRRGDSTTKDKLPSSMSAAGAICFPVNETGTQVPALNAEIHVGCLSAITGHTESCLHLGAHAQNHAEA